jgi:preprotein translocase subunit SecG
MYQFIVVLILVVCVLLAAVILVQNSKGGGLAANFSAPTEIMGVRKTTDFLERATWGLAIALVVLSLLATMVIPRTHTDNTNDKEQTEQTEQTPSATETANN